MIALLDHPTLGPLLKAFVVVNFAALNGLVLIYLERKISAFIQRRVGPTRVGKWGLGQTIADAIKLISKEDVIPAGVDKALFVLAPVVAFAPAVAVYAVVPFGPGQQGVFADLNIGILYIAAVTSFTVLSVFLSGWGSNNKWSLLGAMRAAAQMISYEVTLVMSVVGVAMIAGSLSLQDIVSAQAERGIWFIFLQPLGFIIYLIASIAELNRGPFDLAEAESELVAGFHTEYSGMRWSFFFLAEYANLTSWSAIAATMFLGGWTGPFLPPIVWLAIKTTLMILVSMWIRWTFPRIRIDQLMDLGWKFLLPASIVNILVTGGVLIAIDRF